MTQDEALRLALEALKKDRAWLETDAPTEVWEKNNEAIKEVEAALEAKDEPVGTAGELFSNTALERLDFKPSTKIYITPPPRTWQGLTDDDKVLIKHDANYNQFITADEYADRVQDLTEARLKDKNT